MGARGGSGAGGGNVRKRSRRGVEFPANNYQLKHIFAKRSGHVVDTPANRKLIIDAVKSDNLVAEKASGTLIFKQTLEDGRQVWVEVRNGIIQNGGINAVTRSNS